MRSATEAIITGRLQRLSYVQRYSAQPVIRRENVAEHSFWTAMIGWALAMDVYGDPDLASVCAVRGLFHDIEESMTGDLVRDMKYSSPEVRQAIGQIEYQMANAIFGEWGHVGFDALRIWAESKSDETIAAEIVKLADMLCVIMYVNQEVALGSHALTQIAADCTALIRETFADNELLLNIAEEIIDASET